MCKKYNIRIYIPNLILISRYEKADFANHNAYYEFKILRKFKSQKWFNKMGIVVKSAPINPYVFVIFKLLIKERLCRDINKKDHSFQSDLFAVGAAGFEPAISCSQSRRVNRAALRPELLRAAKI